MESAKCQKLNCMEGTTIKQIRQRIERKKKTRSIPPFKQSLEERKFQVMNLSLIPFKCMCILFPSNVCAFLHSNEAKGIMLHILKFCAC